MAKKWQPREYIDIRISDDIFEVVSAQAETINDSDLARFLAEISEEGCHLQVDFYKERPQATIIAKGAGDKGQDVAVSAMGETAAEAVLVAYSKVRLELDWKFGTIGDAQQKPPDRWS